MVSLNNLPCPIFGFAAFSGVGKTSLITQVITLLREKSLRIGVVKHAHHDFEIDKPEKDSYKFRKSGATQTLVASANRWALINEFDEEPGDNYLAHLLDQLDLDNLDIVIVEGFKRAPIPKIELHRPSLRHPLLFPFDPNIVAFATDELNSGDGSLPTFDLGSPEAIAEFIQNYERKSPLRVSA
ncbi:MAG: molybdopterin-guanine dinucleotide biosynthesis protein B [Rhodospirillales bacterium]|nr:molybdopterin-guanine dinucleotide biosynthesis protein B [Rhodospirillales bacterium]